MRTRIDFEDSFPDEPPRRRKARFDDAQPRGRGRLTEATKATLDRQLDDLTTELPGGDRWSTWAGAEQGPLPRPNWVVTSAAATDTELGVLKSGKEADVHLIRRAVPGTDGRVLAAKRYRSAEHRLFHRDAGYLEGRRLRRSRETRAIANRTSYGRNLIAEQWAGAEFVALSRLWAIGAPVPTPCNASARSCCWSSSAMTWRRRGWRNSDRNTTNGPSCGGNCATSCFSLPEKD